MLLVQTKGDILQGAVLGLVLSGCLLAIFIVTVGVLKAKRVNKDGRFQYKERNTAFEQQKNTQRAHLGAVLD